MKNIILALLYVTLAGCASTHPVVIGCHPNMPPEPHYPVQDLKAGDTPAHVVKSYVATVQMQHDVIQIRDKAIKGCE